MRVLVLDEELPVPPDAGKRIRTLSLLSRLARKNEITFLAPGDLRRSSEAVETLRSVGLRVILVPVAGTSANANADGEAPDQGGIRFLSRLLLNMGERYPYSVVRHFSREVERAAVKAWSSGAYDLVHCEWTPFAPHLRQLGRAPAVIMCHNVESEIWGRQARYGSSYLARAYSFFQWRKMDRFEREAFRELGPAIVVSERDGQILRNRYGATVLGVVENGVDTDYFTPHPEGEQDGEVVFVGSMDWRPNQDAVNYLLDEIWPRLRVEHGGLHLTIVGRRPPRSLVERCARTSDVDCTGRVDDVRPYLERAALVVVPLRIGGGSRIKILEAMSAGKAVVATRVGAEGLEVEPGRHCIVADSPRQFADEVGALLVCRERRTRLGDEGRRLVTERYGWDRMAGHLHSMWEKALRQDHNGNRARRAPRSGGSGGRQSVRVSCRAAKMQGERVGAVSVMHLRASEFVGGPEKLILEQCNGDRAGRYQFIVTSFTARSNGDGNALLRAAAERGLSIASIQSRWRFDPSVVQQLARLIEKEVVDIICAHGYRARLTAYAARILTGRPVVAVCHGWTGEDAKVRIYETVDRRMLRYADHVVAVSRSMERQILGLGVEDERISVIPNSIELARRGAGQGNGRSGREGRRGLRADLGIGERIPLIISAGRLSPEKGHRFLLRAVPAVLEQIPEAHIAVLGEGPERGNLEAIAQELGIEGHLSFPGFRSDLDELWEEVDLFVLPSLSEGLPLVILEAMGAGVPCVATEVGGVPEVIRHRETGMVVPAGSPCALAHAILEVMSDLELRSRLGRGGRRLVRSRHAWSRNRELLGKVYERVLAKRR